MDLPFKSWNFLYTEKTEPLHAMLINCGHQYVAPGEDYSWSGLRRGNSEFVIWQYTIGGHGSLRLGKMNYLATPGKAMLLIVPEDHCYEIAPDSSFWEFNYVTLNGAEVIRLAREIRRRRGVLLEHTPDSPVLSFVTQLQIDCNNQKTWSRYQDSALAYQFMMNLLEEPANAEQNDNEKFFQAVRQYCVKHISNDLDGNELANVMGYSRGHFHRRFVEAAGKSPRQFVLELKMRYAVRLLQTSPFTVKEVASECGFQDPSYFCKVFKAFYQSTPADFRIAGSYTT